MLEKIKPKHTFLSPYESNLEYLLHNYVFHYCLFKLLNMKINILVFLKYGETNIPLGTSV